MKKKGFTLIELLAVIVILAIIALIATPIVMNVIENSKKGAAERSAENYLRAVETAIAAERLDGPVTDGSYKVDGATGDLVLEEDSTIRIQVDVNGTLPKDGTIVVIVNGLVDKTQVTIVIGDYTVKGNEDGDLEATKSETGNTSITVYRRSEDQIKIGQEIDLNDTETFKTNPSDLEKPLYLKHVVENNIVTESYACVIFNGNEEVCLRGGVDTDGNSYYNENKSILLAARDIENLSCYGRSDQFSCSQENENDGTVRLEVTSSSAAGEDDNDACGILVKDGLSFCISK